MRGVRRAAGERARRAMRGGLVVGARIVCDARADARGLVAFARCAVMHGMRRPMRCELVAMQCAARGLVAFARCRRHHAF